MAAIRLCPVNENQKVRRMVAESTMRRADDALKKESISGNQQVEQVKLVVFERRSRRRIQRLRRPHALLLHLAFLLLHLAAHLALEAVEFEHLFVGEHATHLCADARFEAYLVSLR